MGIDFNALAAKAVTAISKKNSASVHKKYAAPAIPQAEPIRFSGGQYICGYACKTVMPASVTDSFYAIAGHAPGVPMEGVHDPITVSAMWIGCEGGAVLMVAADIIGLTNTEVRLIRQRLLPFCLETGCKSVNICCSHTHAGFDTVGYWGKLPLTGKNDAYMAQLFDSICAVCRKAYDNRRLGTLHLGYAHVPDAQHIRSYPKVYHDTLTRLRFVPADGSAEIWFLNFAAHPNTLGGGNRFVSADYPYYLRESIMRQKRAQVLFGVGAIGAVDPGMYSDDRAERTRLQGEALAAAALAIDREEELKPEMAVLCQPFYYPVDNTVLNFLSMLRVMSCDKYPCEKGALQMALKSEMTLLQFGRLQVLLLPGELFPALAYGGYRDKNHSAAGKNESENPEPLTQIAGDEELLIFGVTNDMTGYVVPPNEFVLNPNSPYLDSAVDKFGNKHYHETNSLGLLSAETIAETFRQMVRAMGKKTDS